MLRLDNDTHVLVLTGAGVSAESGIPTFRGAGGLWENHRIEDVASPDAFARDPELVWRFYSERRRAARAVAPNPGHAALAACERALGERFLLATQNVDDLHRRAGSARLVELHGNLFTTRCSRCARAPFRDDREYAAPPPCDQCGALLRPHIVWFGEALDPADLLAVQTFLRRAGGRRLVFVAAGTSGGVWPAAGFVDEARAHGAETWLVNADPADNGARFDQFVRGASGKILPELLALKAS
jgi:NAD-dependent protein deacetylase/lipoamidase